MVRPQKLANERLLPLARVCIMTAFGTVVSKGWGVPLAVIEMRVVAEIPASRLPFLSRAARNRECPLRNHRTCSTDNWASRTSYSGLVRIVASHP